MTTYYTWGSWNDVYTSTTITASSSSTAWVDWNYRYCNGTSTSSVTIWESWNSNTTSTGYTLHAVPETEEQREARRVAEAERAEAAAAAKERATELLLSVLDEQQAADFVERQEFVVEGSNGRRYLIRHGRQHNVFEIDNDGERIVEICGHVRDHVPNEDNMAAQKLALETDADTFLRIANRWDLTRGRAPIREAA